MSFFVVESCALKGCNNWRLGNKCSKDKMYIPSAIQYIANIHDDDTCIVRRQINTYRLSEILEK